MIYHVVRLNAFMASKSHFVSLSLFSKFNSKTGFVDTCGGSFGLSPITVIVLVSVVIILLGEVIFKVTVKVPGLIYT